MQRRLQCISVGALHNIGDNAISDDDERIAQYLDCGRRRGMR